MTKAHMAFTGQLKIQLSKQVSDKTYDQNSHEAIISQSRAVGTMLSFWLAPTVKFYNFCTLYDHPTCLKNLLIMEKLNYRNSYQQECHQLKFP